MGIRVNPSTAFSADVSYIEPVYTASWIDIDVFAEVTFPDFLGVEILVSSDVYSPTVTKQFSEIFNPLSDSSFNVINKNIAETVTLTDVVDAYKSYIRNFDDVLTVPDLTDVSRQVTETDSASPSDSRSLSPAKFLSENLTLLDSFGGDTGTAVIKVIDEETSGFTDSQTVAFSPVNSDNTTTSNSGVVVIQDYSDITYFLQDYVGSSTTFN